MWNLDGKAIQNNCRPVGAGPCSAHWIWTRRTLFSLGGVEPRPYEPPYQFAPVNHHLLILFNFLSCQII